MIQSVKLSKLVLSDINVRKKRGDVVESFAASIAANGVLQNLIVTPLKKPRGHFGIVAGASRYLGMMLLVERGEINADDYDVPVKLMTGADTQLSEVSLVENFQRENMTPADECRGFHLILSQGGDVDALAKRFGVTRRFVEGRLRLATLAEPIFEALASGKITLDLAKAYASTESHERQLLVWNSYGTSSYQSADTIRRVIANESMKSTDPVARLVGADAYTAAGGVVDRDLFSDSGDRWTNPEIAQTLAAALMEAEAKRIGEERGLAWVRPIASSSTWEAARALHRVALPTLPMSETEGLRVVEIEARLDALEQEMADEDIEEDAFKALDQEDDTLRAELQRLLQRPSVLPPELAPRVGVFLTLSHDGAMVIDDTYYSETPLRVTMVEPEEGGEGEADGDETGDDADTERQGSSGSTFRIEEGNGGSVSGKSADTDPDTAAPGGKALSQVLLDQLSVQRRDVLGAALIANPGLALDYMLFVMVDERSGHHGSSGTSIRAPRPQDPLLGNNVPGSRARDYLAEVHDGLDASWLGSSEKVTRFEAFRGLSDEAKSTWLAWTVATSLEAKDGYTTRQNALQNRLATILEVDVASWWRPTSENFFDRVSKGALLSLLDEVGGPALSGRHASQKKTEISGSCQKLFAGEAIVETEIKEAALAWVPSAMRFNDVAAAPDDDEGEGEDDLTSLIGDADDDEAADALNIGPDDGEDADAGDIELGDEQPGSVEHENDDGVNDALIAAE
ncbi:ParB/RepB/Spo0J family partition protein [Sphingomonas lacusdianchii]|uniref:ParB/RepB/Spo0J family partition protein n=1 Tax=Sphingomonas lacusdianchii TaxID=2917992 RepID=UPI001F597311|nr:ParB/RepB/Spo0J family partition protein [Sphingomonas sp. JXJ CY 53]